MRSLKFCRYESARKMTGKNTIGTTNPKWIVILFLVSFIINNAAYSQPSVSLHKMLPEYRNRLDSILEELKSHDPQDREKAAIAIFHFAHSGDPRYPYQKFRDMADFVIVVEPLIQALDDPIWRVRANVATALGRVKDERALETLARKLNDENENVRKSIVHSLGDREEPRVISHMIDRLVDRHHEVRWAAAYQLGRKKSRAAIVPLIMVLEAEEKPSVRQAARHALMEIASGLDFGDSHSEWQAWLLQTLQERDGRIVRTSPAEDSSPIARLMNSAVNDKDLLIRLKAEEELIQMGEQAFEYLFEMLKHKDWRIRRTAAKILGSAQNSRAIDPLMIATKDENEFVRESAKRSLEALRLNIRLSGDRKIVNEQDFSNLEALKQAVRHKEALVRRKAAIELGKIEDREAIEVLIIPLLDDNANVEIAARDALLQRKEESRVVEVLIGVLKYEKTQRDIRLTTDIIGILGQKKDPAAISVLTDLLSHRDMSVRQHAISALGALGTTEALTPLISGLRDEVDFVKRTAAAILGNSTDLNLIEPLIHALSDPDPYVRDSALKALVNVTGEDFQLDTARWEEWWAENKERLIQ